MRNITKDKKAQTRSTLIKMILILMGAAIIILFAAQFSPLGEEIVDKTTCKASIDLRAAYYERGIIEKQVIKLAPLKCKTEYICLSKGEACPEGYTPKAVVSEDDIRGAIAYEMYQCWDMFSQGEKQFLSKKTESQCVVCSVLYFGERIRNSYQNVTGLNKYMLEKNVPGKDFKYMNFIEGAKVDELYDTKEKLTILYTVSEKGEVTTLGLVKYDAEQISNECKNLEGLV